MTYVSSLNGVLTGEPRVANNEETGSPILYVGMIKALDGKTVTCTVDGTKVTPTTSFVNGDGTFVVWIDASNLSAGEHTLVVTAEGYETSTATFTVE